MLWAGYQGGTSRLPGTARNNGAPRGPPVALFPLTSGPRLKPTGASIQTLLCLTGEKAKLLAAIQLGIIKCQLTHDCNLSPSSVTLDSPHPSTPTPGQSCPHCPIRHLFLKGPLRKWTRADQVRGPALCLMTTSQHRVPHTVGTHTSSASLWARTEATALTLGFPSCQPRVLPSPVEAQ